MAGSVLLSLATGLLAPLLVFSIALFQYKTGNGHFPTSVNWRKLNVTVTLTIWIFFSWASFERWFNPGRHFAQPPTNISQHR